MYLGKINIAFMKLIRQLEFVNYLNEGWGRRDTRFAARNLDQAM